MTGQEMIGLIEELVEIKVRHHAAMSAKAPNNGNRELARAVAMMNVADRDRLNYIRKALVQALDGVDQPA
jgi:hypothetical protein